MASVRPFNGGDRHGLVSDYKLISHIGEIGFKELALFGLSLRLFLIMAFIKDSTNPQCSFLVLWINKLSIIAMNLDF